MKIQFELDWSNLNDRSTKEVRYIIYPYVIHDISEYQDIEKIILEFALFL